MSKKRKTRQQKIASAVRREHQISSHQDQHISSPTYSLSFAPEAISQSPAQTHSHHHYSQDYAYVAKDARKTLLVIASLAVLNVIVYSLLQMNIIHMPF